MTALASYLMLPDVPHSESRLDSGLLRVPEDARTLAGFRRWVHSGSFPEKLRAHLIQGKLFLDMSKESIQTHVLVKKAMYQTVPSLMDDEDLGQFYPEGVLVTNVAADVSNNPDGVAVLWETFEAGQVRYVSSRGEDLEIEGSPDWIMEVISDSSVTKDRKLLRRAYHKARIGEYWLIDARGQEIDFRILLWRTKGYVRAKITGDGWQASQVFGHEFRLSRRRNRLGDWHYTLEVR